MWLMLVQFWGSEEIPSKMLILNPSDETLLCTITDFFFFLDELASGKLDNVQDNSLQGPA